MCLTTVNLTAKQIDDEFVFEGYKIFRLKNNDTDLYNYNSGSVIYAENVWHKAELYNRLVGSFINDKYVHGFHFFASLEDAKKYRTQEKYNVCRKVLLKEIVAVGTQCGVTVYCANWMKIPTETVKLSSIKHGKSFKMDKESDEILTRISLHPNLSITDDCKILRPYVYINDKFNTFASEVDFDVIPQ